MGLFKKFGKWAKKQVGKLDPMKTPKAELEARQKTGADIDYQRGVSREAEKRLRTLESGAGGYDPDTAARLFEEMRAPTRRATLEMNRNVVAAGSRQGLPKLATMALSAQTSAEGASQEQMARLRSLRTAFEQKAEVDERQRSLIADQLTAAGITIPAQQQLFQSTAAAFAARRRQAMAELEKLGQGIGKAAAMGAGGAGGAGGLSGADAGFASGHGTY